MTSDAGSAEEPYTMRLLLGEGFHDHTVVITMNDCGVYARTGVTTDPMTARAAALAVPCTEPRARMAVSVTPGDLWGTFDVDISQHPHVAISLVGDGTVAFETSTVPFR
jgi:hypothetical protein